MITSNRYTSAACNRTPESLDWGEDGLIYFAACHAIAVFDSNFQGSSKIVRTLYGHTARVNTVKKVRNVPPAEQTVDLLSGSDDGTCVLWDSREGVKYTLKGHSKGVTQVEAIYHQRDGLLVATGSADSSVKLWRREGTSLSAFKRSTSGRVTVLPSGNQFVVAEKLAGHSDWVRGLDCVTESDDLLLASSSQDSFIRLWIVSPRDQVRAQRSFEEFSADEDIVLEERVFSVELEGTSFHYALSLESVLQGHEGWVYGVHFNKHNSKLRLLSSSIDKTLTIWSPSPDSGIWYENVRVGEVGGSSLGFYGGKFSPDGKSIIGHGFQGSLHLWHQDPTNPTLWTPGTIIGGHFSAVRDLAWDPQGGHFLVTLSADQTTRIHAEWSKARTWHEIARPQVHGYDMQCLALLSRYRLASGAEEKIVRVFQAPGNFVQNFRQLCGVAREADGDGEEILKSTPQGASVPSLGLSNKPVFNVDAEPEPDKKHVKDMYPEHYFVPTTMNAPPTEETLMQNTLWPEMQKLYGHGYEIYALAATSDGRWLASASRATSVEHAKILICLLSPPNNALLLAVSRDRTLSVFQNKEDPSAETCDFQLLTQTNKQTSVHTRIIWCCDWAHDSDHFVTGSREGKVVLWAVRDGEGSVPVARATLDLKGESVTAVAFARRTIMDEQQYLVAVGLEKGSILLYSVRAEWRLLVTIDQASGHHLTVKRLAFRPSTGAELQLASCGDDHFVRIYDITC
ncbi:hypothetical protein quinque_003179 [Culex quinquefasciatus]